jgi:hypothetical protein
MDLDAKLRTLAHSLDADYFGVADLSSAHDFILAQGGKRVARYPRAITTGMVLQNNLVNLLLEEDSAAAILYRHSSYDVVNIALDQMALRVANSCSGPDSMRSRFRHRSGWTMITSAAYSLRNSLRTLQDWAGSGRAAC